MKDLALQSATTPRLRRDAQLLVLDAAAKTAQRRAFTELPQILVPGDLLVVNDAATLPASLSGFHRRTGAGIEIRLLHPTGDSGTAWEVALFGAGTWRTPTELRAAPPILKLGDQLQFGHDLLALVDATRLATNRVVTLTFQTSRQDWLAKLYRHGRPVQYAYHEQDLELWDQQTIFATQPVALEPPSAALHLHWQDVFALQERGIKVSPLTHATGLSHTGDAWTDRHLPFPERYYIPAATVAAILAAKARGGRLLALGTGVLRALESAARVGGKSLSSGRGETSLHLGPDEPCRLVQGLLTGMHEPESSHLELLGSLADRALLRQGYELAAKYGFLGHEYGDKTLLLASTRPQK